MNRISYRSLFAIMIFVIPVLFSASCRKPLVTLHPDLDMELLRLSALSENDLPAVLSNLDREDEIAAYFRDPAMKARVLSFFTELTHSEGVAVAILANAERTGVPTSLAFALAYEESRFQPDAMNDNGPSVDRGLFQLNSKSFPKLTRAEFYDPAVNARYGMDHLEWCLRSTGNEVAALAMYNAGMGRITGAGTPRVTLDYIYRVQKYQENIAALFAARVVARGSSRLAFLGQ